MGVCTSTRENPASVAFHEDKDGAEGFVINYPEGFEESYFIVQGKGVLQWKENGQVMEQRAETGDVVYFPPDVYEHQLLNDQDTPMMVVYATAPRWSDKTSRPLGQGEIGI